MNALRSAHSFLCKPGSVSRLDTEPPVSPAVGLVDRHQLVHSCADGVSCSVEPSGLMDTSGRNDQRTGSRQRQFSSDVSVSEPQKWEPIGRSLKINTNAFLIEKKVPWYSEILRWNLKMLPAFSRTRNLWSCKEGCVGQSGEHPTGKCPKPDFRSNSHNVRPCK